MATPVSAWLGAPILPEPPGNFVEDPIGGFSIAQPAAGLTGHETQLALTPRASDATLAHPFAFLDARR